ncbi:hypothetical protein VNO77_42128 [Canavalia gladiata]|uniref:Uncharacterized protein n=1 Tax=Canavalia gladiata TaxID=3824 RepID=A0AAN9K238_CANGL
MHVHTRRIKIVRGEIVLLLRMNPPSLLDFSILIRTVELASESLYNPNRIFSRNLDTDFGCDTLKFIGLMKRNGTCMRIGLRLYIWYSLDNNLDSVTVIAMVFYRNFSLCLQRSPTEKITLPTMDVICLFVMNSLTRHTICCMGIKRTELRAAISRVFISTQPF